MRTPQGAPPYREGCSTEAMAAASKGPSLLQPRSNAMEALAAIMQDAGGVAAQGSMGGGGGEQGGSGRRKGKGASRRGPRRGKEGVANGHGGGGEQEAVRVGSGTLTIAQLRGGKEQQHSACAGTAIHSGCCHHRH